ncbi:MAG: DNA adenine methylase [Candidatus Bilamarchaeaceae archaeon]
MPKKERLRSPIGYYGGKGNLAPLLSCLVPDGGKPYAEPYAGGASLFFYRDPAPVEALNDINELVVNLFRCFQDRNTFEDLRHRISYTPYAKAEFARALEIIKKPNEADRVTLAWATFVAFNLTMSGKVKDALPSNWSRNFLVRQGVAGTINRWLMRLAALDAWRWRLMLVQIDQRDALEFIRYWDNKDAVFYIDPPYHHDTRAEKDCYGYEVDDEHHRQLVEVLLDLKGAAVLSCYMHPVYEPLIDSGWQRIDIPTACHAAGKVRASGLQGAGAGLKKVPRVETVLRNPKAQRLKPVGKDRRIIVYEVEKSEDEPLLLLPTG